MKGNRSGWLIALLQAGIAAWAGTALADAKVYVAEEGADTVSVLDAASFKKIGSVAVGRAPHNIQVSPDGKYAWVTNEGPREKAAPAHEGMPSREHGAMAGGGELWAIDTTADAVVARIPVGLHPAHVVLTVDGLFAYVTNGGEDSVSVVDTAARRVVATIPVGAFPHGIRISPDGKEAYVANLKGESVSVIDTASRKEVGRIPAGKGPAQVGFTPDGRLAFATLSGENRVALIDPATRKVIRRIGVGTVPIQVYATPDGRMLLIANQGSRRAPGRTVSVVDLETFKTVKTIETGAGAHGVVVDREGRYAYVTNTYANSVSVVDLTDRRVVATVPVGSSPNGISVTP